MNDREQRLVFGEMAERYHRYRPDYPGAAIDDLLDLAGTTREDAVLEVGAGTGKATILIGARGLRVVAIEPARGMAQVARRNCSRLSNVTFVESTFEDFDGSGGPFGLVISAEAWHWVDPAISFDRAHELLRPGGSLALLWNRPKPSEAIRQRLQDLYRAFAPEIGPAGGERGRSLATTGAAAMERSGLFGECQTREYSWRVQYTADEYVGFLHSMSNHQMLEPSRRETLAAAQLDSLASLGANLTVEWTTKLHLGRKI